MSDLEYGVLIIICLAAAFFAGIYTAVMLVSV